MRSVKNIQQITKAMKMVAAARLRRAQEKAASTRPFADKIERLLLTAVSDKSALQDLSEKEFPLLADRPVNKRRSILSANGRVDAAFSCARRRRAAATIFMALVICWIFLTLRIRR